MGRTCSLHACDMSGALHEAPVRLTRPRPGSLHCSVFTLACQASHPDSHRWDSKTPSKHFHDSKTASSPSPSVRVLN
jgi:hypothetical protein